MIDVVRFSAEDLDDLERLADEITDSARRNGCGKGFDQRGKTLWRRFGHGTTRWLDQHHLTPWPSFASLLEEHW